MGGIFISYRRSDALSYAGWLYSQVCTYVDLSSVFMDIDKIAPGDNFKQVIEETLAACDVMLVVIGKSWASVCDEAGGPRLHDPADFVRLEISSALGRGLRVIPLLVNGAVMPTREVLPKDIEQLAFCQFWELSDKRFNQDVKTLIDNLTNDATTNRAQFWTDSVQHGRFHRADRNAEAYRPDILLAFVSAARSKRAWNGVPTEVLATAHLDVDTFSIEYPAQKQTPKLAKEAATSLRTLLKTTFNGYRHLVLVVQESIAIVQQMLIEDADCMPKSSALDVINETALICRCRCMVCISATDSRRGGATKTIAERFAKEIARYETDGLPTPDLLHFSSPRPRETKPKLRRTSFVPGHKESNFSSIPMPLVAYVAQRLSHFRSYRNVAVARQTISRTCAMDAHVHKLFGSQESSSKRSAASQVELLQKLTGASGQRPPLYVITGTAGIGKSVLLRISARRLATMCLRGIAGASLPIFFPLSQFNITVSDSDPERIWAALVDEWVAWVNDLLSSNSTADERSRSDFLSIDRKWVYNQLRYSPSTLILDSVDEFMLNHPHLALTDFVLFLRFLRNEFGENQHFLTLVSMRTSARDATLIAESDSQVLTLRGMSRSEASALFPSAMSRVGRASDTAVQELLLTPLILSAIEESDLPLQPDAYLNRAALIHAALAAIIALLRRDWSGTPYSTNSWINALSLIAWFQYRELRGDVDGNRLAELTTRELEVWADNSSDGGAAEVIDGLSILFDERSRSTLLRRSIFFQVRENSYRLTHKEWGDYLVSRYAVLCVRYQQFDDLAVRALNHDIYIMAGQQLQEHDTDQQTVAALVQRASSNGRFLILGNFAQMLGDSFAPIAADVLDREILAKLHSFPIVVRFALLSALSSRLLLDDRMDTSSQRFRRILLRALEKYSQDKSENVLVKSMSWCFLRAMTNTLGPWPGLWGNDGECNEALTVVADRDGEQFTVSGWQRSVQTAFMRIQFYATEIPSRTISTIHYLYPIVLAYNRGVPLDRTVIVELPSLLSDPRLDAVYRKCPVPEVKLIWNRCQELFRDSIVRDSMAAS